MLDATLIIVNYRTEDHLLSTLAHLQSLASERPLKLIVVDNSPSVNLQEKLSSYFPKVQYIPSPENLGFAGGVNLGLKQADGEFVILLNPDAHPEAGCLAGLISVISELPRAAAAGPKILPFDPKAPLCPSATWRDPSLLAALMEYTPLRGLAGERWLRTNHWVDPAMTVRRTNCAMVQGACIVLKKSWLERVGPFDSERFFLYFEETDFCRRIRLEGGYVFYCPEFACRHEGGASIKGKRQDTARFWISFYAFLAKHRGKAYSLIVKSLLTVGIALEYLLCSFKKRMGKPDLKSNLESYMIVLRDRLHIHLGRQLPWERILR